MEQQKRLQEEKAKKEADKRSRFESQYGGQNNQFWDNFEQGRAQSPASIPASQSVPPPADEDDILSAFNANAPVDASTHFPVPTSARASPQIGTNSRPEPSSGGISMQDNTGGMDAFHDDDPFGLNQLKPKPAAAPPPQQGDDDDFLGLLGKPVSEIPPRQQTPSSTTPSDRGQEQDPSPMPSNEVDRAIAELVDMGFPAEKARRALKTTESGTDVQAAVGWLLTQAHSESRQKTEGRTSVHPTDHAERNDSRNRDRPSWMREERKDSRTHDRQSPASADKDPAQAASQFGNNLLKQAGSLWKTGSKKFQQAVNEFNTEHDSNQPRWMRDGSSPHDEPPLQPQRPGRREMPAQSKAPPDDFTNEALLLESGEGRPRKTTRPRESQQPNPRNESRDQQSSGVAQPRQQSNFLQRPSRPSSQDARSRVSRFAAEEQQAQAYVSPARRKRPQAPAPPSEPAVDLFDSPAPTASRSNPSPKQTATPPARSASIPVRPKAPKRAIPPVSDQALQSTHRHRGKAAESYKRGDYAEAHQSFSTALSMLPDKHPITIIIRSNRAMTALKIGEPKSAVDDADIILTFIGPSKGESETIDLGNGETPKLMKDFYGKALMRKAEALEQLERWGDAAQAWKEAVESGHGGSTSIQGRNRCEKAAGTSKPQSQPAPPRKRPSPAPKKTSALSELTPTSASGTDFEAVSRLRQANQAAERADEEKFALSESVDARIANWRNGKQDNLRALLGSLDTVLWPEAGWKKIGLAELVLPNKVKIQYMKGIGKVHPDKV
jgi:hypothetical protein